MRAEIAKPPGSTAPGSTTTTPGGTAGVPDADANYTKFQGLKGQDFDREFVKFIAEEHEKAMTELQGFRDRVQDAEVACYEEKRAALIAVTTSARDAGARRPTVARGWPLLSPTMPS